MSIREALLAGDQAALLAELVHLKSHPVPPDGETVLTDGESFNDVTVAWMDGQLTDDQYEQAIEAASGSDAT